MVRRIKKRTPKPKFTTEEEFNRFYMKHCFGCRKPFPEDMIRQHEELHRDNPAIRFMIYCDTCQKKHDK